jgi:hypothetical protein
MSINDFLKKTNIDMLWEVISDVDVYKYLNHNNQNEVYNIFIGNIKDFYENEKRTNSLLVDLNKKYIMLIIKYIKEKYPYKPNKIKIHDDESNSNKILITYEEIHNDRNNQFERELNKHKEDFDNLNKLHIPDVPDFSDKDKDVPIREMDKIIKEIQSQRNYDIEEINRTYNHDPHVNNWLSPKETSLKNEKIPTQENHKVVQSEVKSVSFGEITEINEEDNILSKLKFTKRDSNEDRLKTLEIEIKNINNKIDSILQFLSTK